MLVSELLCLWRDRDCVVSLFYSMYLSRVYEKLFALEASISISPHDA